MKKVTIIGVSDADLASKLMPVLLTLPGDFMVEHMESDLPQPPEPPAVLAAPNRILPPPGPYPTIRRADGHVTHKSAAEKSLYDWIMEWLNEPNRPSIHRDELRSRAAKLGYSPASVNPALSKLRNAGRVSFDGQLVMPGIRKGMGQRYQRPLQEVILETIGSDTIVRRDLTTQLVDLGYHRPSVDTGISKVTQLGLTQTTEVDGIVYIAATNPTESHVNG